MNTMFKSGDFFVRLRAQGERPKLTIWNDSGTKIVSEFINSTAPNFWNQMAKATSQEVVDDILALLRK